MSKRGENIYKRKDGRWEGRYIKERSADGKARYAYVYGKSYADAKQKLLDRQIAQAQNIDCSPSHTKVRGYSSQLDCHVPRSYKRVDLFPIHPCEGIAKAFKLLCNEYSMKCIVVLGKADPEGKFDGDTYHAWNLVKVGNGSYHVDVTWDNMFEREIEHISYDYFNVTTEDILKDHQPMGQLPICTDTGLNYFHCTKSFVGTYTYTADNILRIAKRFNNQKRTYLLVNPLQAKHIPVSPKASLGMMKALGDMLANKYPDTKLVIGFAETATAIGAVVAESFSSKCVYIHTTRENVCRTPDTVRKCTGSSCRTP